MTKQIPSHLASAVAGCWELGAKYRVTLVRSGRGMRAQQQVATLRHPEGLSYTADVEYDPAGGVLAFEGVGDIHRRVVTLRRVDERLEFAFHSEITADRWLDLPWTEAARCTEP